MIKKILLISSWMVLFHPVVFALETSYSTEVTFSENYYWQEPSSPAQDKTALQGNISIDGDYYFSLNEQNSIQFSPFVNWNQIDKKQNYGDIRELFWLYDNNQYQLALGIRQVFWGVTEFSHLVDIINTSDNLGGGLDGEDKLGQPMAQFVWPSQYGTFEFYVLPYFREFSFKSPNARLSTPLPINEAIYEHEDKEEHVDFAFRYSHNFDFGLDLGLTYFKGTSRDPRLAITSMKKMSYALANDISPLCAMTGSSSLALNYAKTGTADLNKIPSCLQDQLLLTATPVLTPHFDQIEQIGLDLQYSYEGWLLKLETIKRHSAIESYHAVDVGFEYTLGKSFFNGLLDIGIIAEYLYDSRGNPESMAMPAIAADGTVTLNMEQARNQMAAASEPMGGFSTFQDDIFIGTRLSFNDEDSSALLFGMGFDRQNHDQFYMLEASRRIAENWKAALDIVVLSNIQPESPMYSFRQDDHIKLTLSWYL